MEGHPARSPIRSVIACPDCAALQEMPAITSGRLQCWQCDGTLERTRGRPHGGALACTLTTLILLLPANAMLVMSMSQDGFHSHAYLGSGVAELWTRGYPFIAVTVALEAILVPFLRFGLLAIVLSAVLLGRARPWTGALFRWAERFDLWAMPDVFLIGLAIGYSRLATNVNVRIGAGGWCLIGAAFMTMITRATLERRRVWRAIMCPPVPEDPGRFGCATCDLVVPGNAEGTRCPRCRAVLWRRKPAALQYSAALTAAGLLLYPVAMIWPISGLAWFGGDWHHTLFSAVSRLVGANLYFLAGCVFTTSIAIPFIKLAGMGWLYLSVRRRSRRHLVFKTRFYRTIDELGRWSTMDVFTVVVYMPLVQFGQLAKVQVGTGLPALLGVVVLTMFASHAFDPRLLWDTKPAA